MKITLVSDKSLNEVNTAFARALIKKGHEVTLMLLLYENDTKYIEGKYKILGHFNFMLPFGYIKAGLYHGFKDNIPCYLISNKRFLSKHLMIQPYDEAQAISVFCHAVLESFRYINSYPDYIFTDSYKTAAIPILQKLKYHYLSDYSDIKTLHYINDNVYGVYNKSFAQSIFGADNDGMHIMLSCNEVNLTKGAVLCSTRIFIGENGIEILYNKNDPVHHAAVQFGFKIRKMRMGIDNNMFDPVKDEELYSNYDVNTFYKKAENKLALQKYYCLQQDENIPLLVLYPYRTREVITRVMRDMMRCDIQVIIIYSEKDIRRNCKSSDYPFPEKTVCIGNYDISVLKRIFAAADMAVFGGLYSPIGNPAYIASRYGCVPIVESQRYFDHHISYFNKITLDGNGYTYDRHVPGDILYTLWDGLGIYRHDPKTFNKLVQNCMNENYSPDEAVLIFEKECNVLPSGC